MTYLVKMAILLSFSSLYNGLMDTRFAIFCSILLIMSLLEYLFPRRQSAYPRLKRYPGNLSLPLISQIILKYGLFSLSTIGVSIWAEREGFGLFNLLGAKSWPVMIEPILSLIILDLVIYWQHRVSHLIPLLWRFHRVHHTDGHLDATTALRFHPIEIIFSFFLKLLCILLLGVSPLGILIFEVTLNSTAIFNHANFKLPRTVDKFLRYFIVTPDMHRSHHSKRIEQRDKNFGFNLSCWDTLFKSYLSIPFEEQTKLVLGVDDCPPEEQQGVKNLLLQPFSKRGVNSK